MSDDVQGNARASCGNRDNLRAALSFSTLLVALLTVAGSLIAVGGWAQFHFAGQQTVKNALCIVNFHQEMAARERVRHNHYARYIKAKAEMLTLENRLVLLRAGLPLADVPPQTGEAKGNGNGKVTEVDVQREIAVQRDRMLTEKRHQVGWGQRARELKRSFDSGKLCPDRGGVLWPVSS